MFGKEKIWEAIEATFQNDEEKIFDLLDLSGIRFLTMDRQRKIDPHYAEETVTRRSFQKIRNFFQLKVIDKLIDFCGEKNIRLVFLKGIFLAADLYEQIEDRQSKDIDCLIPIDRFPEVHKFLVVQGFECENVSNEALENDAYLEVVKGCHAVYNKSERKASITIEVHCSITNSGNAFEEHSEVFLNHSYRKRELGLDPYVLMPEYNLIYLMLHFMKHLPMHYLQYLLFGKKIELNLQNLLDMALLIEKYKDKIQWSVVLQEAINMRIVEYIETVSYMVNTFFGQMIEGSFLSALEQNREHTRLNMVQYEEYGLGKFMWLFPEFLRTLRTAGVEELLKGQIGSVGRPAEYVKRKGKTIDICRKETILTKEFRVRLSHDNRADLKLNVKLLEDRILISYEVFGKDCCKAICGDEYFKKDGVEFLAVNSDCLIHYMFTIGEENELIISSQNHEFGSQMIHLEGLEYSIVDEDKHFSITLFLPYYVINNSSETNEIIINVGGLVSDPITQSFTGNYLLFETPGDFFNYSELPMLKFTG